MRIPGFNPSAWITACLIVHGMAALPTRGAVDPSTPRSFEMEDASGGRQRPFASTNVAMHVLIFLSVDCPICNRYAPEIRRVVEAYEPAGVRFWLIHPGEDETVEVIRRHAKEYNLPGISLRDDRRLLTRFTGVTVTPEVVVLDRDLRLQYRGRIDDRFPLLGRQRPEPTTHELRDAIEALLAGRQVATSRTQPVGCSIPDARHAE